ncbi:hypothetical protein JYU34_003743 [Plutella xylostella]|uniref:Uncharacterized protein n=1 Tax=Plutella xylostella TaxID=51655 RepID=A0ABQ7PPM7_PLUXY|nr:hypothetical protein JYU34_022651 [Plutella xylostella]KAG7310908.1 hypothetical protein JYU34_003743 [Plutella xylostella]
MTSGKGPMLPQVKTQKRVKLIPPDGGWGWMVLLGTATSNVFNQSMLSLFGLLYGDAIEAMGYNTQGAALVLSTMIFVSNFGGPIAGVLLKLTSARFTAVTGACMCTLGIFFSGFATSLWHLVATYGLLLGFGLGFIQNSSFVSINLYFKLKKSRAVGLANVGTGVGQSLMPHVVRYLLDNYGFQGACIILGGLSLNGICGTLLLQPIEWHMKKVEEDVVVDESMQLLQNRKNSVTSGNESGTVVYSNVQRRSTEPGLVVDKNDNTKHVFWSQKHLNGKTCKNITANGNNTSHKATPAGDKTIWQKMYDLFDISLLSSFRFVNIIVGIAIFGVSINNFSLIYPFFLQKVAHMTKHQTAVCMSAIAIADIAGRLIVPIFQDKYQIRARWVLLVSSVWLLVVRQILAFQTDMSVLIILSCLYGVGRSSLIVSRNLAISESVQIDQVPSAVGLGMLVMCFLIPPSYWFLGWIRDYTGSYLICLTAQNVFIVLFLLMWVPDMLYTWCKERNSKALVDEVAMS